MTLSTDCEENARPLRTGARKCMLGSPGTALSLGTAQRRLAKGITESYKSSPCSAPKVLPLLRSTSPGGKGQKMPSASQSQVLMDGFCLVGASFLKPFIQREWLFLKL